MTLGLTTKIKAIIFTMFCPSNAKEGKMSLRKFLLHSNLLQLCGNSLFLHSPTKEAEIIATQYNTGVIGLLEAIKNHDISTGYVVSFFDLLPQVKIQHLTNIGWDIQSLEMPQKTDCYLFRCEPTDDPDGLFAPIALRLAISASIARLSDFDGHTYRFDIVHPNDQLQITKIVDFIKTKFDLWLDFFVGKTDWIPPFFRGFSAIGSDIIEDHDEALKQLYDLLSE